MAILPTFKRDMSQGFFQKKNYIRRLVLTAPGINTNQFVTSTELLKH